MFLRAPDLVSIYAEGKSASFRGDEPAALDGVSLAFDIHGDSLSLDLTAEATPVRFIRLRWNIAPGERREGVRVLGDAWERGYGNLEWRGVVAERCMPWVFALSDGSDASPDARGRLTECFGVKARPAALAFWQYDGRGVTLHLDVRSGGSGVILNGRKVRVCDIVFGEYRDISAFSAIMAYYKTLFDKKLTVPHSVYGGNTWYYSYGDIAFDGVMEAGRLMAELCRGLERPYMVIDDGWSVNPTDGPWLGGERFPDMKAAADGLKDMGLRPGIWFRPLADIARGTKGVPDEARMNRDARFLDPSHPETLSLIRRDVKRFTREWGFELIKHDYTNCDIFGAWGFQRHASMTDDGWHFYDQSKTSAEIVTNLYHVIREAAGEDTVIIGCNTSGHLIAGEAHLNRTGDDTSGREWERTRRYGVNTLAFRQAHSAFFMPDADCVGIKGDIPWALNREWLRAVAESGTPLFISLMPGAATESELAEIRDALRRNSLQHDTLIPLDWMENTCPERWLLNGREETFSWYPIEGCGSFKEG